MYVLANPFLHFFLNPLLKVNAEHKQHALQSHKYDINLGLHLLFWWFDFHDVCVILMTFVWCALPDTL